MTRISATLSALVVVVITRTLFDAILITGFAFQQSLTVAEHGLDRSMVKITTDDVFFYRDGTAMLTIDGKTVRVAVDHVLAVYDK